jgi:DNA-binding NtrC family response regulator
MDNTVSILVIEDDEGFRLLLHEVLMLSYKNITVCETAEIAIEYLENEKYDIILSDIMMPGMSGIEFIKHIRNRGINTPVVVISGQSDLNTIQESIHSGVNDYIVKPLKVSELPIIIERNLH